MVVDEGGESRAHEVLPFCKVYISVCLSAEIREEKGHALCRTLWISSKSNINCIPPNEMLD